MLLIDLDAGRDSPSVILEVLSPTTRRTDEVLKFRDYITIPTLGTHILAETDSPLLTRTAGTARDSGGRWFLGKTRFSIFRLWVLGFSPFSARSGLKPTDLGRLKPTLRFQ